MVSKESRSKIREAKHRRMRNRISGTAERPRLAVFRSNNHMYAQIIDDVNGVTLCAASSMTKGFEGNGGNKEGARKVGEMIAQAAKDKMELYKRQVEVLHLAYTGTHELMNNGKATYMEVLKAQESLLSAQLNEAENMYNGAIGLIGLYIALGGAVH